MSRAINTITAATAIAGATNLNIDSGTLFVDTTTNFVGVGTASPLRMLHIQGSSSGVSGTARATLIADDTTAYAAGVGGAITFRGKYNSAGDYVAGGYIQSQKTNATDGNDGFDLALGTRNNGFSAAEVLRLTSSGNVGVGTASPIAPLHIRGAAGRYAFPATSGASQSNGLTLRLNDASDDQAVLDIGGNSTLGYWLQATNSASLATNYPILLNPNGGNVGIGVTSPSARLTAKAIGNGYANSAALSLVSTESQTSYITNAGGSLYVSNDGSTDQLVLSSSGNLGVGTAPAQLLHVSKNNGAQIRVDSGTSNVVSAIGSSSVAGYVGTTSNDNFQILTNNIERLRIDLSGDVLVGTTDSALTTGVGLKFTASVTAPVMGYVTNTANGASSNYHIYNINATNNGYRFYVTANGGVSNFSANNVNLSDERLKTNINLSGNYLDKICSIPVKTFNYKDQGEDTEKTIGVLAQEVEAHIPELINNDGFGETPADGIPLKTIYQTDLQYVLMRCVQELKAENDSLKSRIEALESKVTALEAA